MRFFRHWMIGLLASACLLGMAGCDKVKVSDQDIQILKESEMEAAVTDGDTVIVDVRKPDAYAKGHVPNAINIFLIEIREQDPRLANAKRIIVYGNGWTDPLSTAAAKRMMAMGYTGVAEFKGGMELWKESGRQVISSAAPAATRPETSK